MNWIDTRLLAYGTIADHPAKQTVIQALRFGAWGGTVITLLELFHVLTRDYDVAPAAAAATTERLARSPLHWAPVDARRMVGAVVERERSGVQSSEALLLLQARDDQGTLVTHDATLAHAAFAHEVNVYDPITPELAVAITLWEQEHLVGVRRELGAVENWLKNEDPQIATRFRFATENLTALPG